LHDILEFSKVFTTSSSSSSFERKSVQPRLSNESFEVSEAVKAPFFCHAKIPHQSRLLDLSLT